MITVKEAALGSDMSGNARIHGSVLLRGISSRIEAVDDTEPNSMVALVRNFFQALGKCFR